MTDFRDRIASGQMIAGTFVKTPAIEMVEILSMSGLDVLCLDAEHAPFDRARLDACLAVARGRGVPCLVRVPDAQPSTLLQVLDSGADGVVVPHVDSAKKAAAVARACRFGHGGRGFAGSTRSANYATQPMKDVLDGGSAVTVIAQIEDPEGVTEATAIAAEGRNESRGAHARDDFRERDDENWLCHSMYFPKEKRVGKRGVNFSPKTVDTFEPQVRSY